MVVRWNVEGCGHKLLDFCASTKEILIYKCWSPKGLKTGFRKKLVGGHGFEEMGVLNDTYAPSPHISSTFGQGCPYSHQNLIGEQPTWNVSFHQLASTLRWVMESLQPDANIFMSGRLQLLTTRTPHAQWLPHRLQALLAATQSLGHGEGKPTCILVPWRQGCRAPTKNGCTCIGLPQPPDMIVSIFFKKDYTKCDVYNTNSCSILIAITMT